ncbi:MAG: polymer-forming cytoskeletal protein [Desulfatibacillum sp.]|nr:polymer-forming cytoskeletal protein [Desulfatibacillum sp.]
MKQKKHGMPMNTFIGAGFKFEGELTFEGTIRVDGEVNGRIKSTDGEIVVGEKAVVEGDLQVGKVVVAGTLRGTIQASSCVEIQKSGRVEGDIVAPVVTIESGALFHGNCSMKNKDSRSDKTVELPLKKNALHG